MLARSTSITKFRVIASVAILASGAMIALADDAPKPAMPPMTAAEGNSPSPKAGEMAPAISLQDQTGKTVSLAEQKGKWVVLYFYPKDQTPGCTTQACGFRDDIFAFRKAGAVILGVSVDDVASHKEFAAKHGLPFSLLADSTQVTAKRYGVLSKFGPMVIASRDTFLIDPSGKIVKHYDKVKPEGHSAAVLADIAAFKGAKG
jgi:thioredoxin-dependent peroxiredoxin